MMQKKNVLISDANHGGLVLLEEYYKFTNNNLFFYDVYDKLSVAEKAEYSERFNVTFLCLDEIKENEDDFVIVNPVHMPPVIRTDYTHHEFVGYLLGKCDYDFRIIQITGVKGKTTVTSLIGDVLSGFNTLVLTSDCLSYNGRVLEEDISIAPSSIITAINRAGAEALLDSIDFCVFEVSLGVIPGNYLSVLTNVLEDYHIGRGSGCASVAKRSVFSSDHVLCDFDAYNEYYSGLDAVTLSLDNSGADIFADNINFNIHNTTFTINYFDKKFTVKHFALSDFYINNLLFAVSVGLMINIDETIIFSNLDKRCDVKGRNSYKKINEKIIIEDINPGLNTTSIKKCIDNLKKYGQKYQIILGGDYGITCEEIDEEKLTTYIESIKNEDIIFTGKLGENLKKKLKKDYKHFHTLKSAVQYTLTKTDYKIVQIIYRSEYGKHNKELAYHNNT